MAPGCSRVGVVTQVLITEFWISRAVFGTVPLGVGDWGLVMLVLLAPVVVVEGLKVGRGYI
ncbi:MAG TPA: hypothetical protein DCE78_02425 [Bacteroidetes bacterium]|nr:hypothetical protein [Bacteroidota bacterium]